MVDQLFCPDETRKELVRAQQRGPFGPLNGIDYLQVLDNDAPSGGPRQQTLLVHCLKDIPALDRRNVRILGGVRVRSIAIDWAFRADAIPDALLSVTEKDYLSPPPTGTLAHPTRVLVVRTASSGDFSRYRLELIESPAQPDEPPDTFDRRLSAVEFTFKIDCPSDFDCAPEQDCPQPPLAVPQIDYLAKDYASFRRLMLDRLAVVMPDWAERNSADVGIVLVELLAYAADQLSYYQDAGATEAYLDTARRRVSVRRHARLVDYFVHDGANARAWVSVEVTADGITLPPCTPILSREADAGAVVATADFKRALESASVVFKTLHELRPCVARNEIYVYTWGDPNCCLPRGATRATLQGSAAALHLDAGDVLVFQEVFGVEGKRREDADPGHRHVVRLDRRPVERIDRYNNETVLDISWYAADALPFPLCVSEFIDDNRVLQHTSVVRGNVVLADHGLRVVGEDLLPDTVSPSGRYRPQLRQRGLTHALPYDDTRARAAAAAAALRLDLRSVVPSVKLTGELQTWKPRRDLLASDRFAPEFVVEMESDGTAYLRFGDDILGRAPSPGATFQATYWVGNGSAGNVGAGVLGRIVTDLSGIKCVDNPLPASGGTDPEPLDQVRLYAPEAFRTQERAVTADDWSLMAQRHPEVQRAMATRRWTGSWHTWFLTVDRVSGLPVDEAFKDELRAFLDQFRLAGYDLEIDAPRFVPLDIALTVCVEPDYDRSNVKRALLERFSSGVLPDGGRGFFHPDNFTFSQPVFLSQIVAAAMEVEGVQWVQPLRFQRWGEDPHGELDAGLITFARLEIAGLDNDPNQSENGKIEFVVNNSRLKPGAYS